MLSRINIPKPKLVLLGDKLIYFKAYFIYNTTYSCFLRQEEEVSEGTYASTVPDIVTQIARTIDASTELTSQDFQNDESYLLKQKYLSDLQQALNCNTQGHLLRLRRDLSGAVKLYQNSIQVWYLILLSAFVYVFILLYD